MKAVLFLIALCLFSGNTVAQDSGWMEITDQETMISVKMPAVPKLEKEAVLLGGQQVTKDIYSLQRNDLEMYFEATPFPASINGGKAVNKQISQTLKDFSLAFGASIDKKEKLTRNEVDYLYAEMGLSSGEIIRTVFFAARGKLVQVYMIGTLSKVFSIDANYYLLSWNVGSSSAEEGDGPDVTDSDGDIISLYDDMELPDNWIKVAVDQYISASFPAAPFKKTTLVDFGTKEIVVEAWSRHSDVSRLNYVITKRAFGPDEGQLDDEELYEYYLEKLLFFKKLKSIDEGVVRRQGFECKEYVLAKGIRFYKLQMFRIENAIYQVLVKGGRKNIHQPEADRFLGGIKRLN